MLAFSTNDLRLSLEQDVKSQIYEELLAKIDRLVWQTSEGAITWEQRSKQEHGIPVWRGIGPDSTVPLFQASSTAEATLEEMQLALFADNTAEYQLNMMLYDPDSFMDGRILDVIVPHRATDNSRLYVDIKWFCLKGRSKVFQPRDFIIVDYIRSVQENNTGTICRFSMSIDVEDIPSFELSHGITRGNLLASMQTFSTTETPGVLDVTCTCQMELRGKYPSSLSDKYVMLHVLHSVRASGMYVLRKRLHQQPWQPKQRHVRRIQTKSCISCFRSFWPAHKRLICCRCDQAVCSQCCIDIDTIIALQKVTVVFCHACVQTVKGPHQNDPGTPAIVRPLLTSSTRSPRERLQSASQCIGSRSSREEVPVSPLDFLSERSSSVVCGNRASQNSEIAQREKSSFSMASDLRAASMVTVDEWLSENQRQEQLSGSNIRDTKTLYLSPEEDMQPNSIEDRPFTEIMFVPLLDNQYKTVEIPKREDPNIYVTTLSDVQKGVRSYLDIEDGQLEGYWLEL